MEDYSFRPAPRMVETQIRRRGLAMGDCWRPSRAVPRHLFVPDDVRRSAYDDMPLPIGHGQTIRSHTLWR